MNATNGPQSEGTLGIIELLARWIKVMERGCSFASELCHMSLDRAGAAFPGPLDPPSVRAAPLLPGVSLRYVDLHTHHSLCQRSSLGLVFQVGLDWAPSGAVEGSR